VSKGVKSVFSTPWFQIEAIDLGDQCEPYYRFTGPDGAVIWPVTNDNCFVLVRQYRPAQERYTLEFPAGLVEYGEDPAAAARRELYEETGYRAADLKYAGSGVVRIERENARIHFFAALGAAYDPEFQAAEPLNTVLLTPRELKELVARGEFDHVVALAILPMINFRFNINLF
jgi:ADP-ribose pyrophosphatase